MVISIYIKDGNAYVEKGISAIALIVHKMSGGINVNQIEYS